jgi:hypothetical protein
MSQKFIVAAFGTNATIDNEGRHADPSGLNFLPKPCSKPRTANLPTANTDNFTKPLAKAVAQEKKMTPRLLGIKC